VEQVVYIAGKGIDDGKGSHSGKISPKENSNIWSGSRY